MCLSNPQLWEQWIETNVEEVLEENPLRRVFDASENDSRASGYCICEDCRAWDHPDGEMRPYHWEGLSQQYVALSDRHVTFANQCARLLKRRFPDKELYASMLAYGNSTPGPVEAVPDDNVIMTVVASFHKRKWAGVLIVTYRTRQKAPARHSEQAVAETVLKLLPKARLDWGLGEPPPGEIEIPPAGPNGKDAQSELSENAR